jgi:hypothetical protein
MLESFILEGTKNSPAVTFDKENSIFKVSGRSIVEDPNKFYMPLYNWLEDYIQNPNENTEFVFDLEYFNSSSARQVMKLIMLLEKLVDTNKLIKVKWLYEEGDEMSQERGEEIKAVSKLDFIIEEYPSDDIDF